MVFIRGKVAERFCVRNSGAVAVVEGVGDHGCEYMTGGRAVILGPTGRNFAAGMSGGIAYVWDPHGDFKSKCNMGMVLLEAVEDDDDIAELLDFISMHYKYTGSSVAQKFLEKWPELLDQIVKVMPVDYKRVLMERQRHDEEIEAPVRSVPASA
jgi:glutamate synthase (NADPH/NADH) large chain